MSKSLLCFILLLSSFSIYAQSSTVAATPESPKIKNIRKIMALTGSGKLGIQVMQNMINTFKTGYPNVDPSFWDDFMKEVSPEDLVNMVIPVYDRNFTDEEIDGMLAFYSSPVGQKVLAKLPVVLQESMEAGQSWGAEISKKIIQRLQQKGYIKEG
ncbi:MAG: DUF2059 domain-containing protein [Chitinophagaceae bacterium]|nr:DUF2059 domain-containing protein [Chitinophagaceae bacterium]